MSKPFISQNINKLSLAPFPEKTVLIATCTYDEGNDEFHAILQLAKPTDLDSSGNYNTLTAVAAPYDVNVIEEIQKTWGIFGYPIAFNTTEFPGSEFRNFLFTGDSVTQELDTPIDLFNGISGDPKNSALAVFAKATFIQGNKYPEESVIIPADWEQWNGESDLMIRAGSSTCHFVISGASSYTCIQNLMNYSNEGFFMIFTESEDLGNDAKLFAQDIATLNTTIYSVGATFISMKKYTCKRCGYVAEGTAPPTKCPVCGGTEFVTPV